MPPIFPAQPGLRGFDTKENGPEYVTCPDASMEGEVSMEGQKEKTAGNRKGKEWQREVCDALVWLWTRFIWPLSEKRFPFLLLAGRNKLIAVFRHISLALPIQFLSS